VSSVPPEKKAKYEREEMERGKERERGGKEFSANPLNSILCFPLIPGMVWGVRRRKKGRKKKGGKKGRARIGIEMTSVSSFSRRTFWDGAEGIWETRGSGKGRKKKKEEGGSPPRGICLFVRSITKNQSVLRGMQEKNMDSKEKGGKKESGWVEVNPSFRRASSWYFHRICLYRREERKRGEV